MVSKNLAFIGAGAMGSAIAIGILRSGLFAAEQIHLFDLDAAKLENLKIEHGFQIYSDLGKLKAVDLDTLVLAVKPQIMAGVLEELRGIKSTTTIVSIAAGIEIAGIEKSFPDNPIIRTMPNTPAQISKGITVLAPNSKCSEAIVKDAAQIFKAVGETLVLDESKLNAVTALSGSGPAYFFLLIESMIEAGVKLGLDAESAAKLATYTADGAGALAAQSLSEGVSASTLREHVTSPNGTTQAALESFEAADFRIIVDKALAAACKRAEELS